MNVEIDDNDEEHEHHLKFYASQISIGLIVVGIVAYLIWEKYHGLL